MAFHVTQCPSCESTFNTSARVLESAAGKVRCGACLTIFQAIDNFIDQQSIDSTDDELVFVGSSPHDYFNPSTFLTRSALQEDEEEQQPQAQQKQQALVDSDFTEAPTAFSASDEQLETEHSGEAATYPVGAISEGTDEELKEIDAGIPDQSHLSTDGTLTATIPDPAQITDEPDSPFLPNPFASSATFDEESLPELRASPGPEQDLQAQLDTPQAIQSPEIPQDSTGFSVTETEIPDSTEAAPEGLAHSEPEPGKETQSPLTELDDSTLTELPPMDEAAVEPETTSDHSDDFETSPQDEADSTAGSTLPGLIPNKPEDVRLSTSFQLFQQPLAEITSSSQDGNAATSDEGEAEASEDLNLEDTPEWFDTNESELTEQQLNAEIDEHDFQESIVEGIENTDQQTAEFGASEISGAVAATAESEAAETESAIVSDPRDANADSEPVAGLVEEAQEDSTEAIRARALRTELQDTEALEVIPEENLAALDEFSTPVELTAGKQRYWGRQIAFTLVSILLGAMLAGQYLWRHMTLYSQVSRVRPVYELACSWIDCSLPVYSNIDEIRSENLAIRSHPQLDNSLMVNVAFRNTANFPQPFPVLILSFNSPTNDIVALREFAPQEYLDSALQSINLMPVMSPVQVDMEIVDPGPGASNYTLAFRSPENPEQIFR
ncbi:MAG TPA: hypothetical protein DCM64_01150 [Gammaproteobacteria bacterium]|jgi:predicted Zn finger-like uncharacterized protein|nr:DUF3426 domain-containing protein [Gammaproteobacteria bacterium]MDP6731845.1 DUF3426 domain-containing protein [Gammaproteobacteria bacterium]HAJ75040.1 hypothetical protein [Gammaproteobacteria bacterium]|tara:strand:- start:1968 stop:3971 length:2004 start_codon:yes stop_codon:yes gene_type:complete